MISPAAGVRILVASHPVDFRNGLDGLAAMVQQALHENPFAGDIFVFRAKRADRVEDPVLGRQRAVLVSQTPGAGPLRLAGSSRRGDSPECGTARAAAGGSGVVASAAKASDCAIMGGLSGRFYRSANDPGTTTKCWLVPRFPHKILFSFRRG